MPEPRTFAVGDIHGAARALEQVFERSGFDPHGDRLISLGDLCDGWPEVDRVCDILLGVDRLDLVLGNHDEWALQWMRSGEALWGWPEEGGEGTVASYARRAGLPPPETPDEFADVAFTVPAAHIALLGGARPFLIETGEDGLRRLFTHGGWNPRRPPERQEMRDLRLGRRLWNEAVMRGAAARAGRGGAHPADGARGGPRVTDFDEVYLGHTPTDWLEPRPVLEIWNLDQGAGWDGVLTLMDVHTHEYWQSDLVEELYPGVQGRM